MTSPKNTYHHGDLRQSLIDAALHLIEEEGISDLSLREIARRVGVSHNAPYRHFEDKEALLAAIAEQGFLDLEQAMNSAQIGQEENPTKQLEAIGFAYIHYALSHPAHYRVMFGKYCRHTDKYPTLREAGVRAFQVLVKTIVAGQAMQVFYTTEPINMAQVAWSVVHGQAMLILDNQLQVKKEEELKTLMEFTAKTLVKGFAN